MTAARIRKLITLALNPGATTGEATAALQAIRRARVTPEELCGALSADLLEKLVTGGPKPDPNDPMW